MADYFAEQEKAKIEARRAEKIRNYQSQISSLGNQMDELNMEILKLQKEIERLQIMKRIGSKYGSNSKRNIRNDNKNFKGYRI